MICRPKDEWGCGIETSFIEFMNLGSSIFSSIMMERTCEKTTVATRIFHLPQDRGNVLT
jgi:hypothetical protein